MASYVKAVDFSVKDDLITGDPDKRIKGIEIDDELDAISLAIATKADTVSPTFTGTPNAPTALQTTNNTQIATTAYVKTAVNTVSSTLGTIATQNANNVAVTGGTVSNVAITNSSLGYSNTNVALTATNVQNAIDQLCTLPGQTKSTNYTLQKSDVGGHIAISSGSITVPAGVFATGDVVVIYNNAANSRSILRAAGVTMYWFEGSDANRTLLQRGLATLLCVGSNTFVISGQGVT
jgi:hypothetical protein